MVSGSVEDLPVDRWSVVGGLSVVGGFVIRLSSNAVYYSFLENLL